MRKGLGVSHVPRAPQPCGEALVKVQGRACKLRAAWNPRKWNAVSNTCSHVHPLALIPARWRGQKVRICLTSPSPRALLSCLQMSPCCAWPLLTWWAAALRTRFCPVFLGPTFWTQGMCLDCKMPRLVLSNWISMGSLNCWHCPSKNAVLARCKKTPQTPTTIKTPNPVRILALDINITYSFGGCVNGPLDFLRVISSYFYKVRKYLIFVLEKLYFRWCICWYVVLTDCDHLCFVASLFPPPSFSILPCFVHS